MRERARGSARDPFGVAGTRCDLAVQRSRRFERDKWTTGGVKVKECLIADARFALQGFADQGPEMEAFGRVVAATPLDPRVCPRSLGSSRRATVEPPLSRPAVRATP